MKDITKGTIASKVIFQVYDTEKKEWITDEQCGLMSKQDWLGFHRKACINKNEGKWWRVLQFTCLEQSNDIAYCFMMGSDGLVATAVSLNEKPLAEWEKEANFVSWMF